MGSCEGGLKLTDELSRISGSCALIEVALVEVVAAVAAVSEPSAVTA